MLLVSEVMKILKLLALASKTKGLFSQLNFGY